MQKEAANVGALSSWPNKLMAIRSKGSRFSCDSAEHHNYLYCMCITMWWVGVFSQVGYLFFFFYATASFLSQEHVEVLLKKPLLFFPSASRLFFSTECGSPARW